MGIGLLLLAAATPAALREEEPPDWVASWLRQRTASAEKREAQAQAATIATPAASGGAKSSKGADRRLARVQAGLDALDLWLDDMLRQGLASVEGWSASFWEGQAARLVDAQAPTLAGRVRRLAGIPNASRDWPARLLDELGKVALLTHAFRRLDDLDPPLQEDVRAAIGWTVGQEEVAACGEAVADEWGVVGQRVTTEDRLRTQWTWLVGARTGRTALILQFAHGNQTFQNMLVPGTWLGATLAFWPSAWPQRALLRERQGNPAAIAGMLPGVPSLAAFLEGVAEAMAQQPWQERFLCVVRDVVPVAGGEPGWLVRDAEGQALPLARGEHWRLLAVSGGRAVTLAAEWDGRALLPLGALAGGTYHLLTEAT